MKDRALPGPTGFWNNEWTVFGFIVLAIGTAFGLVHFELQTGEEAYLLLLIAMMIRLIWVKERG